MQPFASSDLAVIVGGAVDYEKGLSWSKLSGVQVASTSQQL
jgi:hypothetical protein